MSEIVSSALPAPSASPDLGALTDRVARAGAFVEPLLASVGRVVVACQRAGIFKVGFITEPPAGAVPRQ